MIAGRLRVGIVLPTRGVLLQGEDPAPTESILTVARQAEQSGIDSLWVGDSLTAKPRLEPLSVLAAVSAVTTRPRLGTSVLLGALRHPVLLAQTAASVDLLSRGRLTLAMGVGGAFTPSQQKEWDNAGVDRRTRASRLEEVARVTKGLLSGETVSVRGKHFVLEDVALGFRPFQRPSVPIFLACHSGDGRARQYRRAAELADGMISITDSPEEFAGVRKAVMERVVALGRDPSRFGSIYYMTVNIDDDPARARGEADQWIKAYYGLNFWGDKWGPFGGAEAITARIREYREAGADEVIIRFASHEPEAQLDRFAADILPNLRS